MTTTKEKIVLTTFYLGVFIGIVGAGYLTVNWIDYKEVNQTSDNRTTPDNPYYSNKKQACLAPKAVNQTDYACQAPNYTRVGEACFQDYNQSEQINQCIKNRTK